MDLLAFGVEKVGRERGVRPAEVAFEHPPQQLFLLVGRHRGDTPAADPPVRGVVRRHLEGHPVVGFEHPYYIGVGLGRAVEGAVLEAIPERENPRVSRGGVTGETKRHDRLGEELLDLLGGPRAAAVDHGRRWCGGVKAVRPTGRTGTSGEFGSRYDDRNEAQ